MAKADFIAAQLTSIQAAQAQAISDGLGATWDESATEQKSSDGTLTQADLDAAVAAAVAPLNAQIVALTAQDASDAAAAATAQAALVVAQQQVTDTQAALAAMTTQDQADKAIVTNLQGAVASVQSALDAIKAAVAVVLTPPSA